MSEAIRTISSEVRDVPIPVTVTATITFKDGFQIGANVDKMVFTSGKDPVDKDLLRTMNRDNIVAALMEQVRADTTLSQPQRTAALKAINAKLDELYKTASTKKGRENAMA